MKRIRNYLFSAFTLLGLCGCSPATPSLSLFAYAEDDTFILSLFDELADDLRDYSLSFHYANRDQNQQNSDILNEMASGADLLLINLVDRLSASAIIEKAYEELTPCIFLNRRPLDNDLDPRSGGEFGTWVKHHCYYVGSYPTYEGSKQAEIADAYFQANGGFVGSRFDKNGDGIIQVGLLKGEKSHQDAEERSSACLQGMKDYGYTIEVISSDYADWERDKAKEVAADMPLDEIELLFANNDDMALGLIDYCDEHQPADFPIVGVDGTKEGIAAVSSGAMLGTVINDAVRQSDIVAELVAYLVKDGPLPKEDERTIVQDNYYYSAGDIVMADLK